MAGETLVNPTVVGQLGLEVDLETALAVVDDANGNYFLNTGRQVVVFHNPTVGDITVTMSDVVDSQGRQLTTAQKDIVVGMNNGHKWVGPFDASSWNQKSGVERGGVLMQFSAAGLEMAVLELPMGLAANR